MQTAVRRRLGQRELARHMATVVIEYIDPDSGEPYWHNPRTGWKTWTKPVLLMGETANKVVKLPKTIEEFFGMLINRLFGDVLGGYLGEKGVCKLGVYRLLTEVYVYLQWPASTAKGIRRRDCATNAVIRKYFNLYSVNVQYDFFAILTSNALTRTAKIVCSSSTAPDTRGTTNTRTSHRVQSTTTRSAIGTMVRRIAGHGGEQGHAGAAALPVPWCCGGG